MNRPIFLLLAIIILAGSAYASNVTITVTIYREINGIDTSIANNTFLTNKTPSIYFNVYGNATSYLCNVTVNGTEWRTNHAGTRRLVFNNTDRVFNITRALSDNVHTIRVNCTNTSARINNTHHSTNFTIKMDNTTPSCSRTMFRNVSFGNSQDIIRIAVNITERWLDYVTLGNVRMSNTTSPKENCSEWIVQNYTIEEIYDLSNNCTYTNISLVAYDQIGRTSWINNSIANITALPCVEGQNWTSSVSSVSVSERSLTLLFSSNVSITGGLRIWMPRGAAYNSSDYMCNYSSAGADVLVWNYTTKANHCSLNITRNTDNPLEFTIAPSTGLGGISANVSNWPAAIGGTILGLLIGAGAIWYRKYE